MNSKTRIGSAQEQHHSGSTDKHIPESAALTDKAPEQIEMWSIFSEYPETLSQCVGRKIKELRLQSAAIALHDDVELDVKRTIAKETRDQQDILVVANEEEETIISEVEKAIRDDTQETESFTMNKKKCVQQKKVKSVVSQPDIRGWLNNQAKAKVKEKRCDKVIEILEIPKEETQVPKQTTKGRVPNPDLREWLVCKSKRKGVTNQDTHEIIEIPDENPHEIIEIPDENPHEIIEIPDENQHEVIEILDESQQSLEGRSPNKLPSGVEQPDIRNWLTSKPSRNVKTRRGDARSVETEKAEAYDVLVKNLYKGEPDEIVSKNFLEMRRRDYRSLEGKNYLNDKIIDE